MRDSIIYYSVGALLYCPANNESIVNSIMTEKFGYKFSLALCLEDTINDDQVEMAEDKLIDSLKEIQQAKSIRDFYLPKIFIRVRYPEQITEIVNKLGDTIDIICGFIAPKFDNINADSYISIMQEINKFSKNTLYFMPIFESNTIVNLSTRHKLLYDLKAKLDTIEPLVLNVRVGGNDLCHSFGIRRHSNESIHSIGPIDNILSDILTVFSMDYVVSGPVWEYYNGDQWEAGLRNEIAEDLLCGFIGKTVIHPNQISVVNDALRVPANDLADAKSILKWDTHNDNLVSGSISKERMNEYKTHSNWAVKTLLLAEYYGIR